MSSNPEPERRESFRHADGRVCWCLPYALERSPYQLHHGWFYGEPPDLRRCDRDHEEGQP